MKLEVLPASFGDCLLLTCFVGNTEWRLLVDTGPDETYPALRRRLLQIPLGQDGFRTIHLFVVTHIDHDHIGGAALLLADAELRLKFRDIWFNAPPTPKPRGVAEGARLAALLGAGSVDLPWNKAWSGSPIFTAGPGAFKELGGQPLPRITLLSPTSDSLGDLFAVWARELATLRAKGRDPTEAPSVTRGPALSIEELAKRSTAMDSAVANGSSIALLVEHQGASVLLGADAFSTVLVPAIEGLAKKRGVTVPLRMDILKLPHHGSRANVTQDLMRVVHADHYVVSTNGDRFKHPDQEAIARVIVGSRSPTLWFNYVSEQTRPWGDPGLQKRYGYAARFTQNAEAGVTIELARR